MACSVCGATAAAATIKIVRIARTGVGTVASTEGMSVDTVAWVETTRTATIVWTERTTEGTAVGTNGMIAGTMTTETAGYGQGALGAEAATMVVTTTAATTMAETLSFG